MFWCCNLYYLRTCFAELSNHVLQIDDVLQIVCDSLTRWRITNCLWLTDGKLRKPQECFHTRNLLPDLLAFLVNPSFSMYRDLHSRRSLQIFRESRAFEKKLLPIPRASVTWRNFASQRRRLWFLLIGTVWSRWTQVFLMQATGISLGFRVIFRIRLIW